MLIRNVYSTNSTSGLTEIYAAGLTSFNSCPKDVIVNYQVNEHFE